MKKNMKRVVTLVLCAVMTLGLLAVSASAENTEESKPDNWRKDNENIVTTKSVEKNGDNYDVTIESYVSGSAQIKTDKVYPDLDIVIAMDVSAAMNEYMTVADKTNSETINEMDTNYGANENVYQLNDTLTAYAWLNKWRRMKYDDAWKYMAWKYGGSSLISDDTSKGWIELNSLANSGAGADIHIKKIDAEKIAVQNLLKEVANRKTIADQANAAVGVGSVNYRVSVVQYAGDAVTSTGAQIGTSNVVCGLTDDYKSIASAVVIPEAFTDDPVNDSWQNPTRSTTGKDYLEQAMVQAEKALTDSDADTKKIVILFSSSNTDNRSYERRVDGDALNLAKELGATVYTVSVGKESDSTLSNIAAATGGAFNGYATSNALNNAFSTIFNQIEEDHLEGGAGTSLNSSAVLRDTVTTYFEIVGTPTAYSATESGVKVADYSATVNNNTVEVTGFDYSAHWIGENASAPQKMVLKFTIKPKAGFLGGNGVPTNVTADCGIYSPNTSGTMTLVENFPEPDPVDVPLKTLTIIPADKNVYLGNSITFDQLTAGAKVYINYGTTSQKELDLSDQTNFGLEAWQGEFIDSIEITGAKIWGAKYTNNFNTPKEVSVKEDSEYYFKYTIKKKNGYSTTNDTANVENTKKIFLYTPNLTYDNETIYLGNDPKLEPNSTVWKHGDTVAVPANMIGAAPTLSDFTYDKSDFTTCQENVTLTELKINGAKYTSTYAPGSFTANSFAVHVLKPNLTAEDVTIYRGNSVNLNGLVSISEWYCGHGMDEDNATGDEPDPDYSFTANSTTISNPTAYKPNSCTGVTASWTLKDQTFTDDFTVHVLQPDFAVTVNDVWADYGTNVTLAGNCVNYTVDWKENCASVGGIDGAAAVVPVGVEPTVVTADTAFAYDTVTGLTNGVYTVGESDQQITLTKLNYKFSNGLTGDVDYNLSFTVHVNTFDLTINKTWTGAVCYKQDTIFTVTGGPGNKTLKVVIPQDKASVTVAGLLCGQSYAVTEDTSWSWRWNSSTSNITTTQGRIHTHATEIATAKPDNCTVTMTFKNTLNKTQWLSGTDYVNNVYSGGSWDRIDGNAVTKVKRAFGIN